LLMGVLCIVIGWLEPAALGLAAETTPSAAWHLGRWIYWPAAVFWGVFVPLWLWRRWPLPGPSIGVIIGLILLLPAWLALIQIRQAGPYVLLAVMMIAWLADTGAYFAGRRWGRHKLAPNISPGKTWEGAIGGAVAVVVYGLLLSFRFPELLSASTWRLLIALLALTGVSVMGDLLESLLKRQAGLKDSSNILPGHGGLLDRIDSLTSTLPIVALLWLLAVD
ncbi:MAG: phosphatidate cytidylyltransferase, partial [Candidatus Accumulibacter sp.]|nr:phosphatidate cytidylyltransferase [Accumulibacter sp.]